MKRSLLITAALALLAPSAHAHMVGGWGGCGGRETASLNVNFNFKTDSFAGSKEKFDDEMKKVDDFAKQQHIGNLTLQSMNYNVSSQHNFYNGEGQDTGYQLSGNANYRLDSADDAFKLADFLTKQHFIVSVNINRYNAMPCPETNNMNMAPPPPVVSHPRK